MEATYFELRTIPFSKVFIIEMVESLDESLKETVTKYSWTIKTVPHDNIKIFLLGQDDDEYYDYENGRYDY